MPVPDIAQQRRREGPRAQRRSLPLRDRALGAETAGSLRGRGWIGEGREEEEGRKMRKGDRGRTERKGREREERGEGGKG
eukprot:637154-Rhodomonas_salina.1